MEWKLFPLLLTLGIVTKCCADTSDDIIDLTWSISENKTLGWPGPETNNPFELETVLKGDIFGNGIMAEAHKFSTPIHAGTHMDAPCHVCVNCEETWRMHEIPMEMYFGPLIVIDINDKVEKDPDFEVTMEDIREFEEKYGAIPKRAFVLLASGGYKTYVTGDNKIYLGSDRADDYENYHWPGISLEVANYLVDVKDIKGYGVDRYTIEPVTLFRGPKDKWFRQHAKILENNRLIFEHVFNAERVPPTGYSLHAIPLKLHNSCGAPVRLLAMKSPPSAASGIVTSAATLIVAIMVAFMAW